jgi:hypothetical protein
MYNDEEGRTSSVNLDDWLTVHHSITLVNFKLDAQDLLKMSRSMLETCRGF